MLKNELGVSLLNGVKHVFFTGIFVTIQKIVAYSAHDHDWLLSNVANALAQCLEVDLLNVLTVKTDLTAISRVVESFD